ncbi:MAG: class I SAM-dependent methyltransferase [Phycisphaerales bacterium]|nr:class I SAM-dependent methyltransferase [Phycisphaerales bacterium]
MATTTTGSFYDTFYADGGWQYGLIREWLWHRRHMVKRFGLKRGMRMLEAACGLGFHTNLFCRMGFDCVGVDTCATGINTARQRYPKRDLNICDVRGDLPFDEASFDVVVTRGCSLYHYDLAAPAPIEATTNLMRYLKPGGRFILIIVSDLSGQRDPVKIWQNRLEDYRAHFSRFDANCTVDWHRGVVICGARRTV